MGMWKYLLNRLLLLIPTLIGVTMITFLLIRSIPGDPVTIALGESPSTPEEIERLRSLLGLDQPPYIQFFLYLRRLLNGDLGRSILTGRSVLDLVSHRFQNTFQLAVSAILISVVVGVGLGLLAAIKKGTKTDSALRLFSLVGFSVPSFVIGLILMLVFAVHLNLFPAIGIGGIGHLILPAVSLSIYTSSFISRIVRACVLDVLGQDFMVTARAKGLARLKLYKDHILKNAAVPIITVIGMRFGRLVGGTVITEVIFSYPGLGLLLVEGVFKRDYPVVQGGVLLSVMLMCIVNLIVDFLYVYLDPRIRYER